jgi:hypothetical protein
VLKKSGIGLTAKERRSILLRESETGKNTQADSPQQEISLYCAWSVRTCSSAAIVQWLTAFQPAAAVSTCDKLGNEKLLLIGVFLSTVHAVFVYIADNKIH